MKDKIIVFDTSGNQIFPTHPKILKSLRNINCQKIFNNTPSFLALAKSLKPTETIKLIIPKEIQKELLNGTLKLVRRKDGSGFLPTLQDAHGVFSKQFIINNEMIMAFPDLVNSIEEIAVQQQLNQTIEALRQIDISIDRIMLGQHNDRIALVRSAEQQLLEAQNVKYIGFRNIALGNAIKTANDARALLYETMNAEIKQITTEKMPDKKVEASVQNIKNSIQAILKATKICAESYFEVGEMSALQSTVDACIKWLNEYTESDFAKLDSNDVEGKRFWVDFPKNSTQFLETAKFPQMDLIFEIPAKLLIGDELANENV